MSIAPDPTQVPPKPKAPTGATDLPVSPSPQSPTPSTQPVGPAPTTPLPLATNDPLAFSPNGTSAPPSTNPQAAVQAWDAYSPLSGMTEDQKALYWGNQGVPISGGGTSFQSQLGQYLTQPSTPGGSPFATPDAQAGYQSTLSNILGQNASQIQGLNQQVASGTQGAQAALNGSIGAANTASQADEAKMAMQQIIGAGGQYPSGTPTPPPAGVAPTGSGAGSATPPPMSIAGAAPSPQGSDVPPTSTQSAGGVQAPSAAGTSGAGGVASGLPQQSGPGYSLNPTDPNNALTGQTITPGNTDFMGQVQQLIAANNAASQPQFEAELRDANRYAAANGRLGSGIENTSLGDIVANRNLSQNQMAAQLGYNALGQQNENNYRNIGVEQQQQGFQNEQQNEAFQQALAQLTAGSQGDPSQIALVLSQIFGSQGGNAANAASQYVGNQTAANNSQLSQQQLMDFLRQLQSGGSTQTSAVGT